MNVLSILDGILLDLKKENVLWPLFWPYGKTTKPVHIYGQKAFMGLESWKSGH